MNLFAIGMMASGGAWAGEEAYVLESVAVGDFDCSGRLSHAELWSSPETEDIAVVLTLSTPEEQLPRPFSGSDGWSVAMSDVDREGCQDLQITVKSGDIYRITSREHQALVDTAQRGAGDTEPDLHILLKKPVSFPTGTLDFGLFAPWCDYFDYCWLGECYNSCAQYGWVSSYPCGVDESGRTVWCPEWGCTHVKQHCI